MKFDVYQSHDHKWNKTYHIYKGKYEAPKYEHYYGRYVVSKPFYLTKKYVKIDVTNKYEEKNKEIEVVFKKEFKLGYDGHVVYPKDYELKLTLICGGVTVAETGSTHYTVKVPAEKVRGKHCELVEYFKDDQYKTVQYLAVVDDGVGDSPALYNDCNNARDYYCEFKRFDVDKHATKLVLTITNNVKELLEIVLKKEFKVGYDGYAFTPSPHEFELKLICGGETVATTDETHYSTKVYADQVRGKECELKEYFVDDEYKLFQYSVLYDDGTPNGARINPTYNTCNLPNENYCEFSRYNVSANATKLSLFATNNVQKKHQYPS